MGGFLMSLVGFRASNHIQQVNRRGANDTIDERITPQDLYERFNARFRFTLDAAANARNAKCPTFFSLADNALTRRWAPHRVWCNPPYSDIPRFVAKAHCEYQIGCDVIVMLLPANRTEQAWWQRSIEPFRDRPGSYLRTEFIARRLNFGVPGNEGAKYNSSAPFGCVAVIWSNE